MLTCIFQTTKTASNKACDKIISHQYFCSSFRPLLSMSRSCLEHEDHTTDGRE